MEDCLQRVAEWRVKLLIGLAGSGILLGSVYASDGLARGEVYDMPLTQVHRKLSAMPIPALLIQATSGSDATVIDLRRSPDAIGWHFLIQGQDVAVFTARLSREGASRTRVTVDYSPKSAISPHIARLNSTMLARNFAQTAMGAQLDAWLNDHPLNQSDLVAALGRHASDHPEQVREYGLAMQHMYQDVGNDAAAALNAGAASEPDQQIRIDDATRPAMMLPVN